jgi:hypothetical protein
MVNRVYTPLWAILILAVLTMAGLRLGSVEAFAQQQLGLEIPRQSDWVDRGIVLSPGAPGTWDTRLGGMISPATVVKKGGIYFLYYIGADGNRSTDGDARHRALGVATSRDGIRFTKYSGNPILTFLPNQNEEEGIFSAGGTLDHEGNIVIYYGAMNAHSKTSESVTSDIRLASSVNGLQFTDKGVILSYRDKAVWGRGDELFPVGVLHVGGKWHVYYIAKSGMRRRLIDHALWREPIYWNLGIASGPSQDKLGESKGVITRGSYVIGGGDPVWLGQDRIALFIVRDFTDTIIEARTASALRPDSLSDPLQVYRFHDLNHATTFFDKETNTWFLYYLSRSAQSIRVKTAVVRPAGTVKQGG